MRLSGEDREFVEQRREVVFELVDPGEDDGDYLLKDIASANERRLIGIVDAAESALKENEEQSAEMYQELSASLAAVTDKLEETEAALENIHVILDNDPSKIIRNHKDGYPEGRPDKLLTLEERVMALCLYAADWKRWFQAQEAALAESQRKAEAYKKVYQALFNKVNRVTAEWRHQQTITPGNLDDLSNRQIECEESLSTLLAAIEAAKEKRCIYFGDCPFATTDCQETTPHYNCKYRAIEAAKEG